MRALVQQAHSIQLSPKESRALVDQLLNPPTPNPALRTAAVRQLQGARYWLPLQTALQLFPKGLSSTADPD
jgi:hypothetical protein